MKLSDYVVEFFRDRGITEFFGYQGTMITHFVDSIGHTEGVTNHSCYNEQGAAFAACGLAQATRKPALAYATSGPGAVNLLSGIVDAQYDSLPVVFITGQVNTNEQTPAGHKRQHTFQELDIVSMAAPVTKYAVLVNDAARIRYELEKALWFAKSGRPGSVLIDLPMNVQRADVDPDHLEGFTPDVTFGPVSLRANEVAGQIISLLASSERPAIVLGNGVSRESAKALTQFAHAHRIPLVTSLLGKDLVPADEDVLLGFIGGAYGFRVANLVAAKKADLLLCFGSSMVTRQTGTNTDKFAADAVVVRIDIDDKAFMYPLGKECHDFCVDANDLVLEIQNDDGGVPFFDDWLDVCKRCQKDLKDFDDSLFDRAPNRLIEKVSDVLPQGAVIASDVGQHMMWIAQSLSVKQGQRLLFSGGHGAMGYALPAAIGASYASDAPVYCIAGDGSFQMNIQELEWVVRENIPVKMLVLNNHSLGMVRANQKSFMNNAFEGTSQGFHYSTCDFVSVLNAYGIRAVNETVDVDLGSYTAELSDSKPFAMVIEMDEDSFAYPKTTFGNVIWNQDPLLPASKLEELIGL